MKKIGLVIFSLMLMIPMGAFAKKAIEIKKDDVDPLKAVSISEDSSAQRSVASEEKSEEDEVGRDVANINDEFTDEEKENIKYKDEQKNLERSKSIMYDKAFNR